MNTMDSALRTARAIAERKPAPPEERELWLSSEAEMDRVESIGAVGAYWHDTDAPPIDPGQPVKGEDAIENEKVRLAWRRYVLMIGRDRICAMAAIERIEREMGE